MDRKHLVETIRRAHAHRGASLVEILTTCHVFNNAAFDAITSRERQADMLIHLEHGTPIRFGRERERGVSLTPDGHLAVVDVADVGEDAIVVHDEHRDDPGLAFMLPRLGQDARTPTPIGVFRDVPGREYSAEVDAQLSAAVERFGRGDLASLLRSAGTWDM